MIVDSVIVSGSAGIHSIVDSSDHCDCRSVDLDPLTVALPLLSLLESYCYLPPKLVALMVHLLSFVANCLSMCLHSGLDLVGCIQNLG